MDFEVKLCALQDVVSSVFDAAPQKMTSGLNSYVRITVDDAGLVHFHFVDTDLIIKTNIIVEKYTVGECSVDLGMLYRAISAFKVDDDTISTVKLLSQSISIKNKSTGTGDKSINHRRVIPLFDAPAAGFSDVDNNEPFKIKSGFILEGLKKIAVSLTPYVDKNSLSGVLVDSIDGVIRFVSMNVVSLTEYKIKASGCSNFRCVLPGKVVSKIIKVLSKLNYNDQIEVLFSKDGSSITINAGLFLISFPLSKEEFRDYSKLMKDYKNCATIEADTFVENIRNLSFALNKDDQFRVSLAMLNGEMTLSVNESENSGIEVAGFNEEFHIDFNAFLLEAVLKNIPTDHFNLHFKSNSSPVLITNTGTEDYTISSILAPLQ